MQSYFVPVTKTVTLPNGNPYRLLRGIHPVPEDLANHNDANALGIKPVEEMTDAEYRSLGMRRPEPAIAIVEDQPVEKKPAKS